MKMQVHGYAAHSPTDDLTPYHFERREPRTDDVVIEIQYCGVCHSDIHNARNDWGNAIYPMVPGHEIIGRVLSVGAGVANFKPNDHVGVGCMVDSCQHCEACEHGLEQYCVEGSTYTYNGNIKYVSQDKFNEYLEYIVISLCCN